MSKVIFLDIDGVLNNSNHTLKLVKLLGENQCYLLNRTLGELPFDYESCVLLQKAIKQTQAEIVLSSTWRLDTKNIKIIKKYANIEIKNTTPILGFTATRGDEIQQYLNTHKEITNYVILDDDKDMLENQLTHFVNVDWKIGFCKKDYEKVIKILEERN